MKKLNYFYVEQPGDTLSSPIGSDCNNALLKVIRLLKEQSGYTTSPQKVEHFLFLRHICARVAIVHLWFFPEGSFSRIQIFVQIMEVLDVQGT